MDNWIGTVGGLVGLVVFLGAVVVYLRGASDKGTIATLEANNAALTERVRILDESEKALKQQVIDLTARVAALESDKAELLKVRPSAERLDELQHRLDEHDAAMKQFGEQIVSKLDDPAGKT